ncbi:YfjI family protein [Paraburkholderia sp. CNPSo 3274]|uniref:YfjI family protein n=1 Tax=Paraburkholderia sp. CNPSo 3274 TaxID=2940932 RepID=UPI0020B69A19|nr:YfjI family protein [Paraburkholderia sp. CNPSo 3274]MCP3706822.1 YfjI family protein [Paraburkholderia sp. CNPSo 3274]
MANENDFAKSPELNNADSRQKQEESLPAVMSLENACIRESHQNDANSEPADVVARMGSWAENKSRPRFPDFEPEDETFPWQSLPETIRGAVIEICKNDKLAVPIAVQAVLSAVSLACQDLIWVDRGIGDKSVCSLYMLTVTDTGSRKSRADSVVTSSIEVYDRKMRAEYARQKEADDYELRERSRKRRELEKASGTLLRKSHTLAISGKADADQLAATARAKQEEVERELAEMNRQDVEYREARLRRVFYSKIPIRELEQNLAENWPSAGLFSDEAAGILSARGESDMSSLDKLWEGKAIDVVGRTTRESFFVEDPRLSISLMVQPIVFDRFLERKGELAKGIGFMSRVLLSRPDTPYGKRMINTSELRQSDWIAILNERVLALLSHAHSDIALRERNRKVLYFAPAAQQAWEKDFNEMEAETADRGQLVHEREFVNRYSEHVARLAALFHFFEHGKLTRSDGRDDSDSSELLIPEATVTSAMRVAEWYLDQFRRVFNPEVAMKEMANHVLQKLKERLEIQSGPYALDSLTMNESNLEYPANRLRVFCTKYGLKGDVPRYREVLSWLEERGNISIKRKEVGSSSKPTDMVHINYEITTTTRSSAGGVVNGYHFKFRVDDGPKPSPTYQLEPHRPRVTRINGD